MTWDNEHTKILFKEIEEVNSQLAYLAELIGETQDAILQQLVNIEAAIRELPRG